MFVFFLCVEGDSWEAAAKDTIAALEKAGMHVSRVVRSPYLCQKNWFDANVRAPYRPSPGTAPTGTSSSVGQLSFRIVFVTLLFQVLQYQVL